MILPVRILTKHVDETRAQLQDLLKKLTDLEKRIASSGAQLNPEADNKTLNDFSLEHMRLHRRSNFQHDLAINILKYIAEKDERLHNRGYRYTYPKSMKEMVERQLRYSRSSSYDFETIPRRIRNQSKAVSISLP